MEAESGIRVGSALPGAGMATSAPSYDYSGLLGKRVTLTGSGENSAFEANLPRDGVILSQVALDDWGKDWLVLRFDEPFGYPNRRPVIAQCLVRARWWGTPIGSEFAPVFVLTDPDGVLDARSRWTGADFEFVTWGQVEVH